MGNVREIIRTLLGLCCTFSHETIRTCPGGPLGLETPMWVVAGSQGPALLPGFGELEEYFLPREIGEITGQARVPFGSSERFDGELQLVTLLDPVGRTCSNLLFFLGGIFCYTCQL